MSTPYVNKDIDKKLFVTNIKSLIRKSDIVVELIGGVTDAKEHVFEALSLGKNESNNCK